jgi:16S rRNA (guanine1516-N2)-methyltransferase
VRIAVTTPLRPTPDEESDARAAAARHGFAYAPRGSRSVARAATEAGADGVLLLSARRATLVASGEEHAWSPGMGALRAKRVSRGLAHPDAATTTDRDPFHEAADLRPGDTVLDCTLGLGADALVAAVAVGATGRVVGIESSPVLAAWVTEGLARSGIEEAGRIEVRTGDHAAILSVLPERSFDVVVFDPMFRHPRAEPGGFDVVRRLADARPLELDAVTRARRVARRWVVVKDGAPGWDLARLGLTPLPSARGAHRYYARLPADGTVSPLTGNA